MCFIIDASFTEPKIAEQNIQVLKKYFLNANDVLTSVVVRQNAFFGQHLYSVISKAETMRSLMGYDDGSFDILGSFDTLEIEEGLHSYDPNNDEQMLSDNFSYDILIKCIIPKGATYYHNSQNGSYVSNELIVGQKKDIVKYSPKHIHNVSI